MEIEVSETETPSETAKNMNPVKALSEERGEDLGEETDQGSRDHSHVEITQGEEGFKEFLKVELPGFSYTLGSNKFDIFQLASLALQLKEKFQINSKEKLPLGIG